jgi:hypothetical protein
MKYLEIYKAGHVGDHVAESVTIRIHSEMPKVENLDDAERIYQKESDAMANTLCSTLPQGMLDRLIGKLMLHRARFFILPLFNEPKSKCDCCEHGDEYNGFASGPLRFTCPKHCGCHD